jgi:hypothetical protein
LTIEGAEYLQLDLPCIIEGEGDILARLTVPNAFIPALAKLSSLPDESVGELISALNSSTPALSPKAMASRLGPMTPSIQPGDLNGILEALMSLSAVRYINNVPISSFLDDVCESLSAKKADVNTAALKSRLGQLLQTAPVALAAKASTIQREHPNVLINARILTDLRPVFGDSPESVQAAVVFHNLKLTYMQCNESREFFVALDDQDLAMLQKTVIRAEAKSKALRTFAEKSGLPDLEPT